MGAQLTDVEEYMMTAARRGSKRIKRSRFRTDDREGATGRRQGKGGGKIYRAETWSEVSADAMPD